MADRVVRIIPARKTFAQVSETNVLRVAAYARVSTDSDEQMGSVTAQKKDYFEKLIQKRPDWVLVDIYADEGISGTSLNRREAFNRMIADALAGKIDLIITKEIHEEHSGEVHDSISTCTQVFPLPDWYSAANAVMRICP